MGNVALILVSHLRVSRVAFGDEGPSSTNNGRGEHVDGREDQLVDDDILSIDDDYVDLVENMNQMMKDAEVNNEDEVTDRDYAKF